MIYYSLKGEFRIDASDEEDAVKQFHDRIKTPSNELYKNSTSESIELVEEI